MALDVGNGNMYYTSNPATTELRRIPIGGGTDSVITTFGSSFVADIAIDTTNNHIYITSPASQGGADAIYRTNLDETGRIVFLSGLTNPSGLALDIANSHLYFTERESGNSINRINLNGTGQTELYSAAGFLPEGIVLDVPNNRMYVNDDTLSVAGFEISSFNLTGGDYTVLTTIGSGDGYGIALIPEPQTIGLWMGIGTLALILLIKRYTRSSQEDS